MGLWGTQGRYLFAFTFLWLLAGCSPKVKTIYADASCTHRVSPIFAGPTERTYCSTPISYPTNYVTITGTARFEMRQYQAASCSYPNCGLSSARTTQNIRRAEVVAYDENQNIIQCGETDNSGNFSLVLPISTNTNTIKVFSRGENTFVKASVLNCPEENIPYAIEKAVVPNGASGSTISAGTLTADAINSGLLLGAAFNIFDQILRANEFLKTQLNTCGANYTNCQSFSVADKVQVFWTKGFNPSEYLGGGAASYYLPSYKRLFITGGDTGDIYFSDTDHFDNSVILHEYGHFLEDIYSHTDSPGGEHNMNAIIDPRLAWSEGWGDFIQAAIRNEARYRDTAGTPNAASPYAISDYMIDIPIEAADGSCTYGSSTTGCDLPNFSYEGNYREGAVMRALWDIFDSGANPDSTGDDTIANDLQVVWAAMTSDQGFLDPSAAFRNMGLLHYVQMNRAGMGVGRAGWSNLRTAHWQGDYTGYAPYVTASGGCSTTINGSPSTKIYHMNPYESGVYSYPINEPQRGSFAESNLLFNNNFLHYYHPGGGPVTIQLKMKTTDVAPLGSYTTERESDVDLYIYNESAVYGYSGDMAGSAKTFWDNNASTEQIETVTLGNMAAGNYLINIKVNTAKYTGTTNCIGSAPFTICKTDPAPAYNYIPAGDDFDYEILVNGVNLCPAALP